MGYEGKKGFIPFHTGFNSASSTVRGPSMQSLFPKCFSYMFALPMYTRTISILMLEGNNKCILPSWLFSCLYYRWAKKGLQWQEYILDLPSQPPLFERLISNTNQSE